MRIRNKNLTILAVLTTPILLGAYPVFAFVMSSQNYRVQADSINVGGIGQQSASYLSEDTIGEIGSDESQSASYKIRAGYQQMLETYIAISSPADVTMSPEIPGVGGGAGNGSVVWTVTTDALAGYTLAIKAGTAPALASGANSFADYTPSAAGTPDFAFSVAASAAEFAFTPEGADIVQKFLDNTSTCGVGSSETADRCWYNFATSNTNIASFSSSNHPSGAGTTVKFRAESGSSNVQPAGTYTATIIVTATSN